MAKKNNQRLYEPPIIRDLSVSSVKGGNIHPLGQCMDGNAPYEACETGLSPQGENPPCNPGTFADYPKCNVGSVAAVICDTGGQAGD